MSDTGNMATQNFQLPAEQLSEQTASEGVFSRCHAEHREDAATEDLTNRLLAKIAQLEARLYEKELAEAELIKSWNPAVQGQW